jgi:hydrogenase maturation protease
MPRKTVIVGVGNILCRDEGVGIHVIEELKKYNLPSHVEIYDGGTGGLDILEVLEGSDRAIIVDAVRGGMKPGEICCIRLDELDTEDGEAKMVSTHELDFIMAKKIGEKVYDLPNDIILIGVEPESIELGTNLTPVIKDAIPLVIQYILAIINS